MRCGNNSYAATAEAKAPTPTHSVVAARCLSNFLLWLALGSDVGVGGGVLVGAKGDLITKLWKSGRLARPDLPRWVWDGRK